MQDLAELKQVLLNYTDTETSLFFSQGIRLACQAIIRDERFARLPFQVTEIVQGSAMPNGYYDLPAQFASMDDAHYPIGDGRISLKFRTQREFWARHVGGNYNNDPKFYTIESDSNSTARIVVGDAEPGDHPFRFTYSIKPTELVNDTDTNWLLQNHEAVYLYRTLVELAPFRDEDYRAITWAQFYDDAADELKQLVSDQMFPRGDAVKGVSVLSVV